MLKNFTPENPVFQFLEKVFNLMLANFLFLICSIPVVTLGAALAGMLQVAQDQIFNEEQPPVRRFFQAFRENFKQATAAWLMLLVFLAGMGCNTMLIIAYAQGWVGQILKILVGVLVAVVLCVMSYLFPLITRYRNTMRDHLNNSLILAVVKLPRTIVMVLLNTLVFWIPFFSMPMFLSTMVFWLIIGFAFIAYSDTRILAPVFRQMEQEDTVDLMT